MTRIIATLLVISLICAAPRSLWGEVPDAESSGEVTIPAIVYVDGIVGVAIGVKSVNDDDRITLAIREYLGQDAETPAILAKASMLSDRVRGYLCASVQRNGADVIMRFGVVRKDISVYVTYYISVNEGRLAKVTRMIEYFEGTGPSSMGSIRRDG